MKCPNCSHEWTPDASEIAAEFGRRTSRAKARAARRNAKLGGWPKGKKRGKRKPDSNQIAHGVVAQIEKAARRVTAYGALKPTAVRSLDFSRKPKCDRCGALATKRKQTFLFCDSCAPKNAEVI